MIFKNETVTKGFIIAGMMNFSVLIFSRLFTNKNINDFDPNVLSNFGLLMIVIWGIAYVSVAKNFQNVKWLVAVFALEKLIYGCFWTKWMLNNSVSVVFKKDAMAGIFYSIYGINDWLFFVFFSVVFFYHLKKRKN